MEWFKIMMNVKIETNGKSCANSSVLSQKFLHKVDHGHIVLARRDDFLWITGGVASCWHFDFGFFAGTVSAKNKK